MNKKLTELEAKLDGLKRKRAELEAERTWAQAGGDMDKLLAVGAELAGLERAITLLEGQIADEAERSAKDADKRRQRESEARIAEAADKTRKALADVVSAMSNLELALARLDKAHNEYTHATAGWFMSETWPAQYLRNACNTARQAWRMNNPELLGLPRPDPAAERVHEEEMAIERLEKRLGELKRERPLREVERHKALVSDTEWALARARERLARLRGEPVESEPVAAEPDGEPPRGIFARLMRLGAAT